MEDDFTSMNSDLDSERQLTILQVFNRYQFPGGEEASVMRVADTLEKRHQVIRKYYDSSRWAEKNGFLDRFSQGLKMLYNPEVVRDVLEVIRKERPDVILLHNIFPVCSAALLWRLSLSGIPIVHYIHNFRPFSVNGYCWADGKICDSGRQLNFLPEVQAGSWQDSKVRTAWYAVNLTLLHLTGSYRRISSWIAISQFMSDYFQSAGIDGARIKILRHSWNSMPAEKVGKYRESGESYLIFLGRLTEEKGIRVLMEAWRNAADRVAGSELVIAGDGPLKNWVEERSKEIKGIRFVGQVSGDEKRRLIQGASGVVVPSIWWEPLGLVVYEAYDNSLPVLAASSGGLTETVKHGETGLLHQPGDFAVLADQMVKILENPDWARGLGVAGREYLISNASPEKWQLEINRELLRVVRDVESKELKKPTDGGLKVHAYLADQNPKLGRSLGISRMTQVVLAVLSRRSDTELTGMVSSSSVSLDVGSARCLALPWSTRTKALRVATDHFHPLLMVGRKRADVWYYPKGFMPRLMMGCDPAVATIHDTIIQYYQDHYPKWRLEVEYHYWAGMLMNTLRNATAIMTVSENAKEQILDFIDRHELPAKEIFVTYEPCLYEDIPQPARPAKAAYVLHLGSREPHKKTAWLIRKWVEWTRDGVEWRPGSKLPKLHIVGSIPDEVEQLARETNAIVYLPFLEDQALVSQFLGARALLFPSEVEGFGLPAIEAYYLGTPVCYHKDTSVEEVLGVATSKGGFDPGDPDGLLGAFREVMEMDADEIRECGLKLREAYSSERVVERMMKVFRMAAGKSELHAGADGLRRL